MVTSTMHREMEVGEMGFTVLVEAEIRGLEPSQPPQTAGPPDSWDPGHGPEWEIEEFRLLEVAGAEVLRQTGSLEALQEQFEVQYDEEISEKVDEEFDRGWR